VVSHLFRILRIEFSINFTAFTASILRSPTRIRAKLKPTVKRDEWIECAKTDVKRWNRDERRDRDWDRFANDRQRAANARVRVQREVGGVVRILRSAATSDRPSRFERVGPPEESSLAIYVASCLIVLWQIYPSDIHISKLNQGSKSSTTIFYL